MRLRTHQRRNRDERRIFDVMNSSTFSDSLRSADETVLRCYMEECRAMAWPSSDFLFLACSGILKIDCIERYFSACREIVRSLVVRHKTQELKLKPWSEGYGNSATSTKFALGNNLFFVTC